MIRPLTLALALICLPGGCPNPSTTGLLPDISTLPSDYDGVWRITSETGLANICVTILGDRVTQAADCEGGFNLVSDAQPSARAGGQIIWSFRTVEGDGDVLHTISVFEQNDGALRGTFARRTSESAFALVDGIIMERRTIRQ